MPKSPETRHYGFTDAELKQRVDQLMLNVNRDITDFNTRGVTVTTLDNLDTMNENFDNLPTDDELIGLVTTATETKDADAQALRSAIRSIRGIASDKYDGGGLYRTFGFEGIDEKTDDELYRMSRRILRVGTNLQAQLETNGLTIAMLDDFDALSKSLDKSIDKQETATENRDIATQTRIIAGNKLYDEYSRLCNIGKSLYADTDEAKYNDYVIDEGDGSKKKDELPVL